jgi:hypothetical protein
MKLRLLALLALLTLTTSAFAAVSPEAELISPREGAPAIGAKAFGDPTDFMAAAAAAADYIRYMQADVTEDNAGNGDPDQDLEDAGWDWVLAPFEHSANASPVNLYGVIANSILDVYLHTGDPALLTVMQDVADHAVAVGPSVLRYAGDITFLVRFADLPGVADPALYRNAAQAIWDWRLANYGAGTAVSFVQYIMDTRHNQGYDNGLPAWDAAGYVEAVAMLDTAFPGMGYDTDAAAMADVMWEDSFNLNPGYFDFDGRCKGFDPAWNTSDYWWYPLGVAGLINAFTITGTHLGDLPLLETRLLECQYADGAFSDQWGAATETDRDWQGTAYAVRALAQGLPQTAAVGAAAHAAGTWLAATQDVSGGFVYTSGNHYPEVGAECASALALAFETAGSSLVADAPAPDPIACGDTKTLSVNFDRNAGTPGLRGYEITFEVTGGVAAFGAGDIASSGALAAVGGTYFQVVPLGGDVYTVNEAILGATPGLLADAPLFTVTVTGAGDGVVGLDILSYKLRDPNNAFMFADLVGASFTVDCTAPDAVTNITADPGHNKVLVAWDHNGNDTAVYEVYRGLTYYAAIGLSAYPEYDDLPWVIPTRPSSRDVAAASGEWELAGTVLVGTTDFVDGGPFIGGRGVYYYEVFAVDAADNGSLAADANDRSTNYWLGDVWGGDNVTPTPNGLVESFDINTLGAAFATTPIDGNYDGNCDVGPTDDWSGFGIPETDNVIDFEDLMIFAMNFGQVSPAKAQTPAGGSVSLAWRSLGDGQWALELTGGDLKGLRVRADVPVRGVSAGDLLGGAGETFLVNPGGTLDLNLALLGSGRTFGGTGVLCVVSSDADLSEAGLNYEARGAVNEELSVNSEAAGGAAVPATFQLRANYPNPFNPMTKISFALPAAHDVRLAVYSLDGRLVTTLLDEPRAAGDHEVTWTGRDAAGNPVASGQYLYRLEAGPYSQVRKMTLMK